MGSTRSYSRLALLLIGVAALTAPAVAGRGLSAEIVEVAGKSVTVAVTNASDQDRRGDVEVTVVQDGERATESARLTVPAGGTTSIVLPFGTITDDINPLDSIYVGIIEGPDPIPQ